jgi:hypothetical protein
MATAFTEGGIQFRFGDSWSVQKYDEHRDYRERIQKLPGSKAVDFVGLYKEDRLYFIEVKDYRGHEDDKRLKLANGELPKNVCWKVRDSIAGLVGAHRTADEPETWRRYVSTLADRKKALRVVLWIEEDPCPPTGANRRGKSHASIIQREIKKGLRWLTAKCLVTNREIHDTDPPELNVSLA